MKCLLTAIAAIVSLGTPLVAQDKPVPKGSARVAVPGCTKGYILTAIPVTETQPGSLEIREGTHLRMNGPKNLINEIKAREGAVVVITGIVKTGQRAPDGVAIGGGIRIAPGQGSGGGLSPSAAPTQMFIDVEGWRPGVGDCPGR